MSRVATKRIDNRGRTYYESSVRFRMPDGTVKRKWVRGRTRAEHDKRLVALRDLRDTTPAGVAAGGGKVVTVAHLFELFIERHVRLKQDKTQQTMMTAIEMRIAPHLFHIKLKDLTPEVVETWIAHLAGETRPKIVDGPRGPVQLVDARGRPVLERAHGNPSINAARQVLVTALNKGRKWRYVRENAASEADKMPVVVRQAKFFEVDEIEDIAIATMRRRFDQVGTRGGNGRPYAEQFGLRDAVMIITLALSGMRLGEALALQWGDIGKIDFRVAHSLNERTGERSHTKTRKERHVPMLAMPAEALQLWRKHAPSKARGAWVFPSDRVTTALRQNTWRERAFKPAARLAGYQDARPHDLRHTFASLMIAAGVSPLQLSEWMGHADPTITMRRYAHLFARQSTDVVTMVNERLLTGE